jgi:ABC-type lipoprotein release transport system permease subunit
MNVVMGVIVAASVLNTVLMAAFERTREIGTMRALGGRKNDVLRLFLFEGSLLGLFGAALGAVLGSIAIVYFQSAGIPAFSEAQKYTYGGDRLYPVWSVEQAVVPPLVMFAVCALASLVPSVLAARRRPADDLRYV